MRFIPIVTLGLVVAVAGRFTMAAQAVPPASQTNLGTDANGNSLRKALKTGHISNYDEARVSPYTLPDPLILRTGRRVTTAAVWTGERRGEILADYESQIYGKVPANAPAVTWEVGEVDEHARDDAAVLKRIVGRVGRRPDGPRIRVNLYTPAGKSGVPVILLVNFGGGPRRAGGPGGAQAGEPPNAAEILAHGWGYATVGYQDIQPDRADAWTEGVIGETLQPGQTQPAPGAWGTIGAWAWGASRIIDYLVTDPAVDRERIAIHGFSRLGKTVLWAAAQDPRIAAVFSACAGEMGSALARRDWGETVDDMAQNFPWQFAAAFQQWVGRWNEMPVDAHMLIALSAPRPVFITGGTRDQWSDPKGEFLAEVAAGPVYRLLGKADLGTKEYPAAGVPVMDGDLAFHLHEGPHQVTAGEWGLFVKFMEKHWE
jgi:hypothetical protein